jgi:hypothetical protein
MMASGVSTSSSADDGQFILTRKHYYAFGSIAVLEFLLLMAVLG